MSLTAASALRSAKEKGSLPFRNRRARARPETRWRSFGIAIGTSGRSKSASRRLDLLTRQTFASGGRAAIQPRRGATSAGTVHAVPQDER